MKNILAAFAVFFGINAFATTGPNANLFNCTGENGTNLTYSSTSFIGRPQLNVQFRGTDPKVDPNSLKLQPTLVGTVVTVTDTHMVPVDGPTVRYSLVVPQVVLSSSERTAKISTVAIKTTVANPFFHSMSGPQIIERNDFVSVECTAEAVVF
jgi:hypothetical protein